jgi:polyhydroxybutyrate depolymerase
MARTDSILLALLVAGAVAAGGCGGDDDDDAGDDNDGGADAAPGGADAAPGGADAAPGGGLLADRPYGLFVPEGHDAAVPSPLILLLHGYGATGEIQLAYFGLEDAAQEQDMLVAYPDGTIDGLNNHFWNATDACCDLYGTGVDDVAYLTALLDDVAARYSVDPARVFVVGHSNGAFMSHRLACDRADRIAAIVSLAGATWADPAQCDPAEPVAILEVHGDADQTIVYEGGEIEGHVYPSAAETMATWAGLNGCGGELEATDTRMDLESSLDDDETRVDRVADCPGAASDVELWTIGGGGHIPAFVQPTWRDSIVDFLLAHPKE